MPIDPELLRQMELLATLIRVGGGVCVFIVFLWIISAMLQQGRQR